MNIVHYFLGLPPLHSGGLQKYVIDLAISQKMSNISDNIYLLFPGGTNIFINKSVIKYYKMYKNIKLFKIINPTPFSFNGIKNVNNILKDKKNNYKYFFRKYKINILHIHSLMGISKELILSAKEIGIKIIFSTHDYYGICPTINLFNYQNEQCIDYQDGVACIHCNAHANEKRYLYKRNLMILFPEIYTLLSNIYRKIKKRNFVLERKYLQQSELKVDCRYKYFRCYYTKLLKHIDFIIFNSDVTKEIYLQYVELRKNCYTTVPVSHNHIKDFRKINNYKIKRDCINLLYMGAIDNKKGFFELIKNLEILKSHYKNWKLYIYGDCSHIDVSKFDKDFYVFNGSYKYENLKQVFENMNLLIVPSKWKETFGFIALEAYSYGIPCLLSENVGFSRFIKNGYDGIVYKEDDDNISLKNTIIKILNNVYILNIIRHNIISNNKYNTFTMDYVTKIIHDIYLGIK